MADHFRTSSPEILGPYESFHWDILTLEENQVFDSLRRIVDRVPQFSMTAAHLPSGRGFVLSVYGDPVHIRHLSQTLYDGSVLNRRDESCERLVIGSNMVTEIGADQELELRQKVLAYSREIAVLATLNEVIKGFRSASCHLPHDFTPNEFLMDTDGEGNRLAFSHVYFASGMIADQIVDAFVAAGIPIQCDRNDATIVRLTLHAIDFPTVTWHSGTMAAMKARNIQPLGLQRIAAPFDLGINLSA